MLFTVPYYDYRKFRKKYYDYRATHPEGANHNTFAISRPSIMISLRDIALAPPKATIHEFLDEWATAPNHNSVRIFAHSIMIRLRERPIP